MDAVALARLQFALTVGFHFIFPAITIGLAWLLVVFEWLGWRRDSSEWRRLGRFFGKLFALSFAMGVASGIVMEFQFGTNWASYSRFVGDIFGAPLAAEGVLAFFLESSFLGLYLFGRSRVSPAVHWFSILMVAVGATLSAFWILVANSWQQTPSGFAVENGRAVLTDFSAAIFNPSMWPRFFHTLVASLIAGSFLAAGISAWRVLAGREAALFARSLKLSVAAGFVFSLMALFPTGHFHAEQVAHTQPEKFAALEGLYESEDTRSMVIFAVPSTDPPELHARLAIPGLLGWLLYGDANAEIPSLEDFPPDETPRGAELWLSFVSFHNMFILGMLFIGLGGLGVLLILLRRATETGSFVSRWWLRLMVLAAPLPVFACELGWIAAEVGRQPWIVYRLLRTDEAASTTVSAGEVLFSLIVFGAVYLALGTLWLWLLLREIRGETIVATEKEER